MTPRQWVVVGLAVATCFFAVLAFVAIEKTPIDAKLAVEWLCGAAFSVGVGLGILAAP